MKQSRVYLYLNFRIIFKSFFKNCSQSKLSIEKEFKKKLNKKKIHLTGMCRTAFLIILEYLLEKNPKKKELIICTYNLKELIDIARLKKFKIVFADLDRKNGMINEKDILNKINKNTAALLFTNMFNSFDNLKKISKVCKKKKVTMIEDIAIYYGNHSNYRYAGSLGDVSILSFGIMKNVSAFFGGALLTNDKPISDYACRRIESFKKFPATIYFKNIFLFVALKFFLSKVVYNFFFFYIIKLGSIKNIFLINSKIYPALKFKKKKNIPEFYYSRISNFSVKIIDAVIKDKMFSKSFNIRKNNNRFYFNKFKNSQYVKTIPMTNFNFQNFLDFPIIVKDKKKLTKHLFDRGLEVREYFYENCENLINKRKRNSASYFENYLLCLPSHKLMDKKILVKYVMEINNFYKTNSF